MILGISVALATFNGSRFIDELLRSLSAQTHLPAELVVTDDNSTDDTLAKLELFSRDAPFPVHIRRNETRLGYRLNFMATVRRCSAEFIALCDQDDVWAADKLAEVIMRFRDPGTMMVHHNARLVDVAGVPFGELKGPADAPPVIEPMAGNPWKYPLGFTLSFRRVLAGFDDLYSRTYDFYRDGDPLAHDQWFGFLGSALGRVAYIDRTFVDYRQHDGNVVGHDTRRQLGLYERLRRKLNRRSEQFAYMARICTNYVAILNDIGGRVSLPDPIRRQAAISAALYGELAPLYRWRTLIYEGPRIAGRARALRRLRSTGAYDGGEPWALSAQDLWRDSLVGVVLGPIVRRYGRSSGWGDSVRRTALPYEATI